MDLGDAGCWHGGHLSAPAHSRTSERVVITVALVELVLREAGGEKTQQISGLVQVVAFVVHILEEAVVAAP